MSMTGGVSFFENSYARFKDGASIMASSNQNDAKYCLQHSERYYRWQSVGSDDVTAETLTISLPVAKTISRIFLIGHNFRNFNIRYGSGNDFTNIRGLDGHKTALNEDAYERDTAYYEFDPVLIDTITIEINTTQSTDAEKYLTSFIVTNEIGTFRGFPDTKDLDLDRNESEQKGVGGALRILKSREMAKLKLKLSYYPLQEDIDLISVLQERDDPFFVWPNGGRPNQFRLVQRGWRLSDLYLMQVSGPLQVGYARNIYVLGVDQSLTLKEVTR